MPGPVPMSLNEETLLADGAGAWKLRLVGPWHLLYGGTTLDTSIYMPDIETDFGAKVAWQVAEVVPDVPESPWNVAGTQRSTAGPFMEPLDLSAKTAHLWARAAVFTKLLNAATTPANAFTRLWSGVRTSGWLCARQTIKIEPSSQLVVRPIGVPFPCSGVTGIMFGVRYYGFSGSNTPKIENPTALWRGFDTGDPHRPGSWATVAAMADVTAAGQVNTGSVTTTTTSFMMMQPGFSYFTAATM